MVDDDDRWRDADEVLWVQLAAASPPPIRSAKEAVTYRAYVRNISVANDVWVELRHELDEHSCVDFDNGTQSKVTPVDKLGRLRGAKTVEETLTRSERPVGFTPSMLTTTAHLGYSAATISYSGPSMCVECHTP